MGDDIIYGGADDDALLGGNGADTLDGGTGDDVLYGGVGDDTLNGGDDNDFLIGNTGADIIHGDAGDDIVYAGADNDTIYGGIGSDTIYGGSGNDTIDGEANQDTIWGGDNDDTINGGNGHDIIFGDSGADAQGWVFEYYDLGSSPTTLAAAGFTANGGMDNTNTATSRGVSQVLDPANYDTGENYALKFETYLTITTAGSYTFRTSSDDGSALFLDEVQIVDNDGLHGVVTVTSATQTLEAGTYKLDATFFERTGGNVMDVLMSGPDTGGGYVTLADYAGVNAAGGAGDLSSGTDVIDAGDGDDTVYGDDGNDTIDGGAGSDILYGNAGDDTIDGGNGADIIYSTDEAGAAVDQVATILAANPGVVYNESTGNFYQWISSGSYMNKATAVGAVGGNTINGVNAHLVTLTSAEEQSEVGGLVTTNWAWVDGTDSAVEGTFLWESGPEAGTAFDNTVLTWQGGSPAGTNTGANDDVIIWDGGGDVLYVFAGAYGYVAEWEGNSVLGTTGTNTLYGGDGSDTLYGTDGVQDIFEFISGDTGTDTINSFTAADTDAVDISDLLTGYTAGVSDINDFVQFTNSGADSLIQVDANGATGGASFTTIGQINDVNDLDADALLYNESIIA
jgi:Ca2+-binding RTX toxin-like protein